MTANSRPNRSAPPPSARPRRVAAIALAAMLAAGLAPTAFAQAPPEPPAAASPAPDSKPQAKPAAPAPLPPWRAALAAATERLEAGDLPAAEELLKVAQASAKAAGVEEERTALPYVDYNRGVMLARAEQEREATETFSSVYSDRDAGLVASSHYNIARLALGDAIESHESGRGAFQSARRAADAAKALKGKDNLPAPGLDQAVQQATKDLDEAEKALETALAAYGKAQSAGRNALAADEPEADASHNYERSLLGRRDAERLRADCAKLREEMKELQPQQPQPQPQEGDQPPPEGDQDEQKEEKQEPEQGSGQQSQSQQQPGQEPGEELQQDVEPPKEGENAQQQPQNGQQGDQAPEPEEGAAEDGAEEEPIDPNDPDAKEPERGEGEEKPGEKPEGERVEQTPAGDPTAAPNPEAGEPGAESQEAVYGMTPEDARAVLATVDESTEKAARREYLRSHARGADNDMEKAW